MKMHKFKNSLLRHLKKYGKYIKIYLTSVYSNLFQIKIGQMFIPYITLLAIFCKIYAKEILFNLNYGFKTKIK